MKRSLILTALLTLVLGASVIARTQQKEKPKTGAAKTGKHYSLPATSETTQWGWLDPNEKPKLTVKSGDTMIGPVTECGPPPGLARRSLTISSIVTPGLI